MPPYDQRRRPRPADLTAVPQKIRSRKSAKIFWFFALCLALLFDKRTRKIAKDIHGKRNYHNPRLKALCDGLGIPPADLCSLLQDEHFGDELHPNERGAKIIAKAVFRLLPKE